MKTMYVYYEEFHDAQGLLSLTEIVLSSWGREALIDWKSPKEKSQFDILNAYFKSVPADKRTYDAQTHIWSYLGTTGSVVISTIQSGMSGGLLPSTNLKKIIDLQDKVSKKDLNRRDKPKVIPKQVEIKFTEEEFFYAPAVSGQVLVGEALWSKLADALNISMQEVKDGTPASLKKVYLRTVMKVHPDRNNGDATKMTELNYLWQMFNA